MLPKITLSASIGSAANQADDLLRSPFYNLTAGLIAPIFNNGRLGAERDKATARQEELLETYRGTIINGFADVEKALNSIRGLDEQRQWQSEELNQAQTAFNIAQSRYQAGAEDLLTVLETQRTLYAAQDQNVQLRLSRMQASIALYKALGGGASALADAIIALPGRPLSRAGSLPQGICGWLRHCGLTHEHVGTSLLANER
jgi:multidrug efflux system outer membrane protein